MPCDPLSAPEEQIAALQARLRIFTSFALAQLEWEAAALVDAGPWFDEMPADLMDLYEDVRALRHQALGFHD